MSMQLSTTGTRRRVQALAALGWPLRILARRLDTTVAELGRQTWPAQAARRAVAALYDELSMTPGPSPATRRRARRYGWAPPLAWDDQTIDQPSSRSHGRAPARQLYDPAMVALACAGDLPGLPRQLTAAERAEATRRLLAQGLDERQIRATLGDLDRVAVDLACAGHIGQLPRPLTRAERAEAVRRLVTDEGLNDHQIAARLGNATRTILRIRTALRLPSPRKQVAA